MAGSSNKRILKGNQHILALNKKILLCVILFYIIYRFVIHYDSVGYMTVFMFATYLVSYYLALSQLQSLAEPEYTDGVLTFGGTELAPTSGSRGVGSFWFDLMWWTEFTQVISAISDYGSYFFIVIPIYLLYRLCSFLFGLFFPDDTLSGVESEKEKKKREKQEKKVEKMRNITGR